MRNQTFFSVLFPFHVYAAKHKHFSGKHHLHCLTLLITFSRVAFIKSSYFFLSLNAVPSFTSFVPLLALLSAFSILPSHSFHLVLLLSHLLLYFQPSPLCKRFRDFCSYPWQHRWAERGWYTSNWWKLAGLFLLLVLLVLACAQLF